MNKNTTKIVGKEEYVTAYFCREKEHRFACEVMLENKLVDCYVASSCKLTKLINLDNKEVIIKRMNSAKFDYSLFALKQDENYILLNLSYVNELVEKLVYSNKIECLGLQNQFIREKCFNGYRSDLYLPDTNTVVEIKTVLSDKSSEVFPSVTSKRMVRQLNSLHTLLNEGYKVVYLIICLNASTDTLILCRDSEYYHLFCDCVKMGMRVEAISLVINSNGHVDVLPVQLNV